MSRLETLLFKLAEVVRKHRTPIIALCVMVVFVTTYMLILPAFTLTQKQAAGQGGIDVPAATEVADSDAEHGTDAEHAADTEETLAIDDKNASDKSDDKAADDIKTKDKSAADDDQSTHTDADTAEDKADNNSTATSESATSDKDESKALPQDTELKVYEEDGEDFKIKVSYGPDAGIPEDAVLEVKEIAGNSKAYANYLEQAKEELNIDDDHKASDEQPWEVQVSFARFFDISILVDGKEIEPEAPVDVQITYVGAEYSDLGAMSIVHFAESGTEVIDGTTEQNDDETTVSFTQDSFSVTGTIINSANLAEDNYYILREDGGRWYALATDGSTVDVTDFYEPTSKSVVNYNGSKNITWEVSFTDWESDGGDGWYYIKAKGEDKYINLNNGLITGTPTYLFLQGTTWANQQGIWINYWSEESGGGGFFGPRYTDHYHHMLSWSGDHFVSNKHLVSREYALYQDYYGDQYPLEVRFAKVTSDSEVVNENYPNNTYNEAQIQAWLDQAMNDKPLHDVSKKASLVDYDNRIYQIDFSARSGVLAMEQDLSLAFVTDVSNSMLFPSKLTPIDGKKNIDLTSGNLDSLPHNNGEVYFTIADAAESATVYALYYDNGWKGMDSSYYARWKAGIKKVGDDNNYDYVGKRQKDIYWYATYLHDNDTAANNTKYTIYSGNEEWLKGIAHKQIYDMTDNGSYGMQADGSITSYNMGNRLYYLESSVAGAVNDMKTIAEEYPLGAIYAGLETFAADVQSTQNYLQIGGYNSNMESANAQYAANNTTIFNALKNLKGFDGTDQRDAFNGVPNIKVGDSNADLPAGTKKVVVMITDGAPNKCKPWEAIEAAKTLKQNGYTVVTIGLSTNEVQVAPEMLWKSASFVDPTVDIDSADKSKAKYYYYAESGEDLTWILRDIVKTVMGQAVVTSTITDTIDPLFYPVDKDGNPFSESSASYIKADGSRCNYNDPDKVGKIEYTNNEWKVTWENQNIPWGGWNSSIFVKAKEDFLGGNSTSTNKTASFVPQSYTTHVGQQDAKTANFTDEQKTAKTINPPTPYVNVDELKMTKNSTTFNVYLGEEVTPADEITKLWNSIVVNTVVDKDGMEPDYIIKNKDQMYYDPNRANKLTQDQNPLNANRDPVTEIPLSHYIENADELLADLLGQLRDGKSETTATSEPIDYAPYGQSKIGTITVKLEKKVNAEAADEAPDRHETEKVMKPAETYTLTVEYVPLTGAERKALLVENGKVAEADQGYMHNGSNGPGKEVNPTDDQVKSTNRHVINVFAKGLKITKTDEVFGEILPGAKFELYRTARAGETGQKDLAGVSGKNVKVADLDASADGFATVDAVKKLNAGEAYYLVETQAPKGYSMLEHPIQVNLEIEDHYYPAGSTERYMDINEGTASPEGDLYCWSQKAKLTLAEDAAVRKTFADGSGDLTHEGFDSDFTTELMYYSIANNPGVELPYTGGIGTTIFYILGTILVLGCGIMLVARRRIKRVI